MSEEVNTLSEMPLTARDLLESLSRHIVRTSHNQFRISDFGCGWIECDICNLPIAIDASQVQMDFWEKEGTN